MNFKQKILASGLVLLGITGGVVVASVKVFLHEKSGNAAQISELQKQILELNKKVTQDEQKAAIAQKEVQNRQVVHEKSQDELLTQAVAKVAPSVVSIVISKDVPKLEVVYQNPFGDDPFFKDFNIRVPVYRQNGVEHKQVGAGTGFIITNDGYILTNKHVVFDTSADYTILLSNGQQKQAQVVYIDRQNDVAIVQIKGQYQAATLGDSASLKLGQTVIAIGNALGEYNNSVSVGIISGLNRNLVASGESGSEQLSGVIQTDAAINPGNSGGPLLDLNGNVVGINVATVIGSSNISFSIPINTVKNIIKTMLGT